MISEMTENESVIAMMIDSMDLLSFVEAKKEIEQIIFSLVPPISGNAYSCEDDVMESAHLKGFAYRLLANKFKNSK